MNARLLPSGTNALLVECAGLDEVLALHDALAVAPPAGVVELVPAARTVLVEVDPAVLPLESAASWVRRAAAYVAEASGGAPADGGTAAPAGGSPAAGPPTVEPPTVELPTAYGGDDLAETAALLGRSPEALVAQHRGIEWRVAFIGFAPGFAYLVSEDWPFDVPRLPAPRTRVPAGAIALAGGYSGAYPRESPGGWRLIGRTDAPLWSTDASPPALLVPGARVRFTEVRR